MFISNGGITMTQALYRLFAGMINYFSGDPKRIQHFTKVHAYAQLIGFGEGLSEEDMFILESAAMVHDIGIKPAEKLYGYNNGKLQEELGPPEARDFLERLGFEPDKTDRICFLVSKHHTYHGVSDKNLQILIEADLLVNLYEDASSPEAIANAYRKVFRTASGKAVFTEMYGEQPE